jgi:hypothetical protein
MAVTYLKRYLFSDSKLRDRALLELTRGLRDGRLIALTGAMSTEALGYYSWSRFKERFGQETTKVLTWVETTLENLPARDDHQYQSIKSIINDHAAILMKINTIKSDPIDDRVHFHIIREAFRWIDEFFVREGLSRSVDVRLPSRSEERRPSQLFNQAIADAFITPSTADREGGAITPLLDDLKIKRFITLNYDLELERETMIRQDEAYYLERGAITWADIIGGPVERRQIVRDRTQRLSRILSDGQTIESDILDRERLDRLFEFSISSPNADRHILHLHGRADQWQSMIVDIRDYDRLYRRDDLFRNPFEHGIRTLFAGNPVLFVGVGMTEEEINGTLQRFVSDSPYRRTAPTFLLWNTTNFAESKIERREQMRLRRLDYLLRLGVFVVFDDDLDWQGEAVSADTLRDAYHHVSTRMSANELSAAEGADAHKKVQLRALAATVSALPRTLTMIERQGYRQPNLWRSTIKRATGDCTRSMRLWGTPGLFEIARSVEFVACPHPARTLPLPESKNGTDRREVRLVRSHRPPSGSGGNIKSIVPLTVALAEPGFGRGTFAEWLIRKSGEFRFGGWFFQETKACHRLLVNAGFSYDSDALLSGIADFLRARLDDTNPIFLGDGPLASLAREYLFSSGKAFILNEPALIIINGVDRFFGVDGAPLSAEFDQMVRSILRYGAGQVQWLLLGTERVGKYFTGLSTRLWRIHDETPPDTARRAIRSRYLEDLQRRFDPSPPSVSATTRIGIATQFDREAVRRAFFEAYLSPELIGRRIGPTPPRPVGAAVESGTVAMQDATAKPPPEYFGGPAALEVLRTMAFIGWPVEVSVLGHAPKVRARLRELFKAHGIDEERAALVRVMTALRDLGLIIEVMRFDADAHGDGRGPELTRDIGPRTRFGLHRSLATELRERHGVPLSEAKLASAFNMSLFAAQPSDDYTPEPQFHDELGDLVDRLIGAWKDERGSAQELPAEVQQSIDSDPAVYPAVSFNPVAPSIGRPEFIALCNPGAVSSIRAALAVIRGYYSTSSLLSLDRNDRLVSASRDGALTDHGDRLDRLMRGFGKIAEARAQARGKASELDARPAPKTRKTRRRLAAGSDVAPIPFLDQLDIIMGPEPFYPDDLVWLHNERGVVKLAQGDLYAARRSFGLALAVNSSQLERNFRGHNWRRITLNIVAVLVERGRLTTAETRLAEIERTIDNSEWASTQPHVHGPTEIGGRAARILELFGDQNHYVDDCVHPHFAREEILMVGLVTGYRGLIAQQRGHERTAQGFYVRAISILRRLGEQRAYALFQRHYASLRHFTRNEVDAYREAELAVSAADAARQMDMAYRARILRASHSARVSGADGGMRRRAIRDLTAALNYSALTDSYRVRIEASACLGRLMLDSGDFDAALRHSSDALTIACRFGHTLHKINLRVQIGDILIQRGDPISGNALLESALNLASRVGYQLIVERVQRARNRSTTPASDGQI